ncbi:hypothetical protein BO71DRAFT_482705 [Aspergillus ellipticus CBS 707.79]|uniref:Zn(2)-C6 fungal-type domain-containing protein n=1 Tax=Aspergillus ellipticus CBS 707.79 TaxID=1448320 RepID=A0A319DE53_9EURO|nr:hypothetical protein BO71DRAFT_482705 [Aspergillus ellipticus CBS 707.79]
MMPPQPAGISTSRRKQIPGTRVLYWQPEKQGRKPLTRRPMTACQACRSAKAKCSRQRRCERCRSRGLRCSYASSPMPPIENGTESDNGAEPVISPAVEPVFGEDATTSFPMNEQSDLMPGDFIPSIFCLNNGPGADPTPPPIPATEQTFTEALEQFDWIFPADLTLPSNCQPPIQPPTTPLPFTPPVQQHPQPLSQPQPPCPCLPTLTTQIPHLERTLTTTPPTPLPTIFQTTLTTIQRCQTASQCRTCTTSPVDLVHIMTVFEQTAACFDYIARCGFEGVDVKLGIGDYCISRAGWGGGDVVGLRRVLVLDLVREGRRFLDGVGGLVKKMEEEEEVGGGGSASASGRGGMMMGRSPRCLNRLNVEYVREASSGFRRLFGVMEGVFEGG